MTIDERAEFALHRVNPDYSDDELYYGDLTPAQYNTLFHSVRNQMQCIVDYGVK